MKRHTTIDERPTSTIPAGVLNAKVEDRSIGDRSWGFCSVKLLLMDAVLQRL
jgi:hypothetical protein